MVANAGPAPRTRQRAKSSQMHARIVDAFIECLDRHGYAAASIGRVLDCAGVSRGAMQHHFPAKADLVVAVAERLMQTSLEVVAVSARRRERVVADELAAMWTRLVDTRAYRALLEILNAMRTDAALRARVQPTLAHWNEAFERRALVLYRPAGGDPAEVRELLVLVRCALRGLVIQASIAPDAALTRAVVRRLIDLVAPRLLPRDADAPAEPSPAPARTAPRRA
ncbi:MAG: TetR/AcrR family transcriptional regulator [Gammaproteobacteria bacterium]|nr:TetR/AcrR family transcriptional regulator [Gammaproteobacteria bacterium]MCP5200873.1 TetR/AcrR family transcriptional regulator [Gammaproteobacteria bacterium]